MQLIWVLCVPLFVWAGYKDPPSFSAEEIARHQSSAGKIAREASSCLKEEFAFHETFYAKWHISPFYGDRSKFSQVKDGDGERGTTQEEKRDYLREFGDRKFLIIKKRWFTEKDITYLLSVLKPTSCIGLVLKCLGRGFESANQADIWQKLKAYTMANGVSGLALQDGLQKIGWKVIYWNPEIARNGEWDENERDDDPDDTGHVWGHHAENWENVKKNRKYLFNKVDDITSFTDFRNQVPHIMKEVPFFVGTAHGGYHVFPGSYGKIVEGHSTRMLDDKNTLEQSWFNPLADDGGPRAGTGKYRSGLVAVPPGFVR